MFASYLSDRKQYLKKENINLIRISQGPTLVKLVFWGQAFLIIYDFRKVVESLLLAGVLKVFHPVNSVTDCLTLQHDFDLNLYGVMTTG